MSFFWRRESQGHLQVAGLMSGTSLDGLTIGLISIEPPERFSMVSLKKAVREAKFLGGKTYPFPRQLRDTLATIAETGNQITTAHLARANSEFGNFCADCVKKFVSGGNRIDLIGIHGQTVYHEAGQPTVTFQLGDPSPVCLAAKCEVVSDFRTMDTAAGGQGAPLVPMVDYLRYSEPKKARLILNLGGIANFTFLPRGAKLDDVRALDVGPANILIDGAMRKLYPSQTRDGGGRLAARGKVSRELMEYIKKKDDYRFLPMPKSTGRERYSETFLRGVLDQADKLGLSLEDIITTISSYSIFMIDYHVSQIERQFGQLDAIIVGGGGSKNRFLMEGISKMVPLVSTHDRYGVPSRFWESFSFAVLAFLTRYQIAGNVPSATGASQSVVLGRVNYSVKHGGSLYDKRLRLGFERRI